MAHSGSHHRPPMQFNLGSGHQVSPWPTFNTESGQPSSDRPPAPQAGPSSSPAFTSDERLMFQHLYHPNMESFHHASTAGFNSGSSHSPAPPIPQASANAALWQPNAFLPSEGVVKEQEKESRRLVEPNNPGSRPVFLFSSKTDSAPRSLIIPSSRTNAERSPSTGSSTPSTGGSDVTRGSSTPVASHSLSSTPSPAAYRSPSSTPRVTVFPNARPAESSIPPPEVTLKSASVADASGSSVSSTFQPSSQGSSYRAPRNTNTTSEPTETRNVGPTTLIPVNLFPALYRDLTAYLEEIAPDNYDLTALQTLIMDAAMIEGDQDLEGDDQTRQALLLQNCIATVLSDTRNTYKNVRRQEGGSVEEKDALARDLKVVERYNTLMEGLQYRIQRLYRTTDTATRYTWTREDFRRFREAFRRFGYAPSANRKIAEYVGKGMQAEHIQYFMRALKQRFNNEQVKHIVESDEYDTLLTIAPEEDGRALNDFLPSQATNTTTVAPQMFTSTANDSYSVARTTGPANGSYDVPAPDRPIAPITTVAQAPGPTIAPAPVPKRRGRPPRVRSPAVPSVSTPEGGTLQIVSVPSSSATGASNASDNMPRSSSPMTASGMAGIADTSSAISLLPSKSFLSEMAVHGLTEEDFRTPSPSAAATSDTGSSSSYTQLDSAVDGESPKKKRMLSSEPFGAAHSTTHAYQPRSEQPRSSTLGSSNGSVGSRDGSRQAVPYPHQMPQYHLQHQIQNHAQQHPHQHPLQFQAHRSMQPMDYDTINASMAPSASNAMDWSASANPTSASAPAPAKGGAAPNSPPTSSNGSFSTSIQALGMPTETEASLGRGEDLLANGGGVDQLSMNRIWQRMNDLQTMLQAMQQRAPTAAMPVLTPPAWGSPQSEAPSMNQQASVAAPHALASPESAGSTASLSPYDPSSYNAYRGYPKNASTAAHPGIVSVQQFTSAPAIASDPPTSSSPPFSSTSRAMANQRESARESASATAPSIGWFPDFPPQTSPRVSLAGAAASVPQQQAQGARTTEQSALLASRSSPFQGASLPPTNGGRVRWPAASSPTQASSLPHGLPPNLSQATAHQLLNQSASTNQHLNAGGSQHMHMQNAPLPQQSLMHSGLPIGLSPNGVPGSSQMHLAAYPFQHLQHGGYGSVLPVGPADARTAQHPNGQRPMQYPLAMVDASIPPSLYGRDQTPQR